MLQEICGAWILNSRTMERMADGERSEERMVPASENPSSSAFIWVRTDVVPPLGCGICTDLVHCTTVEETFLQ